MEFSDGEFGVVLDKGTLDAIATDGETSTIATVTRLFTQVERVLKVGGRYICVSLAQRHVLDVLLTHFTQM